VKTARYPISVIVGYTNTKELDNLLKLCCRKYEAKFGDFEPQHTKIEFDRPKTYPKTKRERVYGEILLKNMSRLRIGLKTLCTGVIMGMDNYNEHYAYVDNTEKIDWLEDFIQDTDETVAIYYNYDVEFNTLEKLMKKLKVPYIAIRGGVKDKYELINAGNYKVMLGQYQAASESLDGLQHHCHIMIMFALPESSLLYKQSIGRINRDGQEKVPMYYYLVTKETIEEDIHKMIESKVEFTEDILEKLLIEE
jgi:SNF2 family DNA or RNA helicase